MKNYLGIMPTTSKKIFNFLLYMLFTFILLLVGIGVTTDIIADKDKPLTKSSLMFNLVIYLMILGFSSINFLHIRQKLKNS